MKYMDLACVDDMSLKPQTHINCNQVQTHTESVTMTKCEMCILQH